jgi:hypothetical protein
MKKSQGEKKIMKCKMWELRTFELEYLINKTSYIDELYLP